MAGWGILITNISLLIFWISLLGSGIVKISSKLNNEAFYLMMNKSQPWFKVFTYSGVFVLIGISVLIFAAMKAVQAKKETNKPGI